MPCAAPAISWRATSSSSPARSAPPTRWAFSCRPFLLEHVEHRQADLAGDGTAAHGREEAALALQRVGDGGGRDHGRDRVPVAGRLRDRDDVGHHALLLEAPEMGSQAPVADLHLVGDADAARRAHVRVGRLQIAVGQHDAPGIAVEGLADERRGRTAVGRHALDGLLQRGGVARPGSRRRRRRRGRGRYQARARGGRLRAAPARPAGCRRSSSRPRRSPSSSRGSRRGRRARRGGRSPRAPGAGRGRWPRTRSRRGRPARAGRAATRPGARRRASCSRRGSASWC